MNNRVTDLGARRIAQNLGELQRVNHYELQVVFPESASFNAIFKALLSENNAFSWFVQSLDLPKETSEINEFIHGNSRVKYAGTTSYDNSTLKVVDSVSLDTEKIIASWRKAIYDAKTDLVGKASDYKAIISIFQYSPDGGVERVWTLQGCWPSAVEYGTLNSAETGFKEISVTLTFDFAFREDV